MLENIFWIVSYVSGLTMFLCSLVFGWFLLKDILRKFHYRQIFFAVGLISVSAIFLYVDMANIRLYPMWAITTVVVGFVLITLSLAKKWWQYFLIPSLSLLYLVPQNTRIIYYLALVTGLALAYLAYKNMYVLILEKRMGDSATKNILARSGWGIAFVNLAIVSFGYTLVSMQNSAAPIYIYQAMTIIPKVVFSIILLRYLVHFANFKRVERLVITFSVCAIAIVVSMNVMLSYWAQEVLITQLEGVVSSEIHASYEMAVRTYPNGKFIEMIKNKDPELITFVDQIYASTKIRNTIFLGDERVAANPSLTTNKRPLGTKIVNLAVRENVLEGGQEYVGKVFTNGQVLIAAYIPIYDGGKVIGMIGTGREISHITSIEKQLLVFYGVIAAGLMVLSTVTVVYVRPDREVNK